jgi:cysteinyl-tRNA synthetase
VDGEKMAKSKGNFYTLDDVLARRDDPAAVRYLLLSVPYRKKLNFTWDSLAAAAAAVERIRSAAVRLDEVAAAGPPDSKAEAFPSEERAALIRSEFASGLDDDLNTPEALAALFNYLRQVNAAIDEGSLGPEGARIAQGALASADRVLGILPKTREALPAEIEERIAARNAARKRRDFAEADRIRDGLASRGIVLEDTPGGTRWKKSSPV